MEEPRSSPPAGSEAVEGFSPEERQDYDQLTPEQQATLAGYTADQLRKVLTDNAVAAAMASTMTLTEEDIALDPAERHRGWIAEQDARLAAEAQRRAAAREQAS